MVRKPTFLIEQERKSFREAQQAKALFSRRATSHILEHINEQPIPPLIIDNPSKPLRLWLEKFPDMATERLGKAAAHILIYVEEPGVNPLAVEFKPVDETTEI